MIKTIDHVGIMTSDLEKSVKFYTGVLGFSIATKMEMEGERIRVEAVN